MKKGILFDLDGTLWDSSEEVAVSWKEALKMRTDVSKVVTVEEIQQVMGKTMDEIADILFSEFGEEKRMELLAYCCDQENEYIRIHGGRLMEGLAPVLKELKQKGFHLYIVSNCQTGYIEAFLEHHGLAQYFDDFESFGGTQRPKGYNIRLVADRNQLEQAVYVGDTQGDYDSAMEAGIPFIHARTGYGTVKEEVPYITFLSELPQKITEIFE